MFSVMLDNVEVCVGNSGTFYYCCCCYWLLLVLFPRSSRSALEGIARAGIRLRSHDYRKSLLDCKSQRKEHYQPV